MSERRKHKWRFGLAVVAMLGSIGVMPVFDGNGVAQALCLLSFMAFCFMACGEAAWLDYDDQWGGQDA